MNGEYSPAEREMIRRMFNADRPDTEICAALLSRFSRRCGVEAVRKQRKRLGLARVQSFKRWTWVPPGNLYSTLGDRRP